MAPASPDYGTNRQYGAWRVFRDRRALMEYTGHEAGDVVLLSEPGREGLFRCTPGPSQINRDPLQGIYVSSSKGSVHYERIWDGIHGEPEWFGAIVDNSAIDNSEAIQACIDLCPITLLKAAKYYIGTLGYAAGSYCIKIQIDGRKLVGVSATQRGSISATELVLNSGLATGILVGFEADPGNPTDDWLMEAHVENLSIRRNTAAGHSIANPATGMTNAPTGLRMQFAIVCKITNVWSLEHSFGFVSYATVACVYNSCRALRYTAGTGRGNDFWAGYWQDNSAPTPYNSGNASLYYLQCGAFSNASQANAPMYSYNVGIGTNQGFTDTYIIGFESSNCAYGIDVKGRSSKALDYHTEDLIITDPVLDGNLRAGIRISLAGANTAVQIKGHYIGCSNATDPTAKGILLDNVRGSVTIMGGQTIATVGNPAAGLYAFQSSGVTSIGNIYTDIAEPIVLDQVLNFRLQDRINAARVPFTQAVKISASSRGTIDCDVGCSDPRLTIGKGVNLAGSGNSKIKVECTGIDPAHMAGGWADKLVHNGKQITSPGAFGSSCLALGIMD